ncbi:Receptor-like protein EIX2 [Linum perenne]
MVLRTKPEWVPSKHLAELDLGSWYVGPGFPHWLQTLEQLMSLDLFNSGISEPIPEWFSVNSNLSLFDFSFNCLEGPMPLISSNLTFLDLSNNLLSGKLLKFLCFNPNQMKNLDLSRNNLSGEIPKQITSLKALKYLNLSHNSFSGAIPEDLTEMQSLECMDLSDNQLSGAIPSSLGSLTFLNHLNLSYNNLGGRIPSSTQLQSFDSSSFTGNRELCGPPLGLNCSIQSGFKDGEEDDKEFAFHWSSGSVFIGFVAGFWAVVGTFVLNQESRKTYFEFVDLMGNKLWNVLIRWLK